MPGTLADYPYKSIEPKDLYLDLLKMSLTDTIYDHQPLERVLQQQGGIWPSRALTMIGLIRLDNIELCMEDAISKGIPGDFIEAGAWRGGATIFMRAFLKAHNVTDRTVWVADSFEGLPPPDTKNFPADAGLNLNEIKILAVSKETVEQNFARLGLLDNHVRFLKGWFKDTLPNAPIKNLAVLRIDGDLYESTMQALESLYPKLSSGGYCIIDDYYSISACGKATEDYRHKFGIDGIIIQIDQYAGYWKKK